MLTNIRHDIAYAVQILSQFMHAPRVPHYKALVHTLHYVHSTAGQAILLKASPQFTLEAYSDSDWAACPNSRK